MTNVLTVRIPVDLLGRAEARAHRLGLDRAKYVRQLIEKDIEEAAGEEESRRRFASEDLAGSFRLGGRPAINTRVRKQLARRARGRELLPPRSRYRRGSRRKGMGRPNFRRPKRG